MGVFSKLKNIFYDEEYVEEKETKKEAKDSKPKVEEIKIVTKEEPKTEVIKEEIKEEITDSTFSERELFKSERTFNFTEFNDDDLPPRKNILDIESRSKVDNTHPQTAIPDVPKVFKPSPIISPIYGILDKDYKKEEIKEKTQTAENIKNTSVTYDTVRRKAYGTLEDDLEDTLNSMTKITTDTITDNIDDIESSVNELNNKTSKIEDLITKIESTTTVGELEEKAKDEMFEEETEEELDDKTMTDSTLEHDLFNLIDSMYDDKED